MNTEVKSKWLEALRSGEYQKGYSRLCTVNQDGSKNYCCLGVLTDLFVKEFPGKIIIEEYKIGETNMLKYNQSMFRLPEEVIGWAGLDSDTPAIKSKSRQEHYLAWLNDNGSTFGQIADVIERHF